MLLLVFCISFDIELCWICLHPEDHESSAVKQDTRTDFDNLGAKGQIRKFTLLTHHPHSSSPLASSLMYCKKNPNLETWELFQTLFCSPLYYTGWWIEILVLQYHWVAFHSLHKLNETMMNWPLTWSLSMPRPLRPQQPEGTEGPELCAPWLVCLAQSGKMLTPLRCVLIRFVRLEEILPIDAERFSWGYLLVCKNSDTILFNITWEDLAPTLSPLPRKLHMMGAKDRGARWRDDSDLYGEVLSADLEAVEVVGSSGGLSLHDKHTIGGKGVRRQRVKRETAVKRLGVKEHII